MHEPPVKKILYWCPDCNVPLIGKSCGCGREGNRIPLLQPFDVRPALTWDHGLIRRLVRERFGDVSIQKIILLNKTGGADRADLVIMNGERFGWLTFDPVNRRYAFDLAPEGLPYVANQATKGVVDLNKTPGFGGEKVRLGGKKFPLPGQVPEGTVIVKYRNKIGTGMVKEGYVRIKEIGALTPKTPVNPTWDTAIDRNRYHLKNLERNAVRTIKQHVQDRPVMNVSFSGGKDSTAVLHIARKAGVEKAFFIDTGIELPETIAFVESQNVEIIRKAQDFWSAAEKAGPPGKDNRWCCKLLKLHPLKIYLAEIGPCVTVQGNRWYESWNRAGLDETSQNPANPLQLNISPIRNWRALEVFLYLWWQNIPINPLYEKGLERIGCFLCPAMLESEYNELRSMHPSFAKRWDDFVSSWGEKKGYPDAYCSWGLWRWRALPRKMRELCREKGINVNEDFTLAAQSAGDLKAGSRINADTRTRNIAMHAKTPQQDQAGPLAEGESPKRAVTAGYDVEAIRKDFPILGNIVYLDNAATSFSPEPVVAALVEFEHQYRANVGRGVHRLTRIASQRYWHAHEKVAEFIGGTEGTTVFVKNTTEAINMVAQGMSWEPGERIVTTILEHHSNLLPWMNLKSLGVEVDVVDIRKDLTVDPSCIETAITDRTKLVAVTHASNVTGTLVPVEEISTICRKNGVRLLIDSAQTVPHFPVDVAKIGCDFCAFSGHKMLGPTGTGVLWMKDPILRPSQVGGGMVESVTRSGFVLSEGYQRYEAGTPNIAGGIGLGVAAEYLGRIGMTKIRAHEEKLTTLLISGLARIPGVDVYAPPRPQDRVGVVSFTVEGLHPHEVAQHLDEEADIMVRSGHHCCQPLIEKLGLAEGTVRASIGMYTTENDIDLLVASVAEISR